MHRQALMLVLIPMTNVYDCPKALFLCFNALFTLYSVRLQFNGDLLSPECGVLSLVKCLRT